MVNRNLLRQFEPAEDELQQEMDGIFGLEDDWLPPDAQEFRDHKLVTGRVLHITGDGVWVDVGYKSEGVVDLREWNDEETGQSNPPKPGDQIEVLLETVEDANGVIVLSYRKAQRQREWDQVIQRYKEGDAVSGVVTRKVKGGLLVNIGANVFLPGQPGRCTPAAGHRRLHRQDRRVQDPQDR